MFLSPLAMCVAYLVANKRSVTHAVAWLLTQLHVLINWSVHALPGGDWQIASYVGVAAYAVLSMAKMLWCHCTKRSDKHTTPVSHRLGMHGGTALIAFVTGQRHKSDDTGNSNTNTITACWQDTSTCWQMHSASMWLAVVGCLLAIVAALLHWACGDKSVGAVSTGASDPPNSQASSSNSHVSKASPLREMTIFGATNAGKVTAADWNQKQPLNQTQQQMPTTSQQTRQAQHAKGQAKKTRPVTVSPMYNAQQGQYTLVPLPRRQPPW